MVIDGKVDIEPRVEFPSPGRCIYCGIPGTKSQKLTLEHIIPLGWAAEKLEIRGERAAARISKRKPRPALETDRGYSRVTAGANTSIAEV